LPFPSHSTGHLPHQTLTRGQGAERREGGGRMLRRTNNQVNDRKYQRATYLSLIPGRSGDSNDYDNKDGMALTTSGIIHFPTLDYVVSGAVVSR
jgi:hypothetical protein